MHKPATSSPFAPRPSLSGTVSIRHRGADWLVASFHAMGSACEIVAEGVDPDEFHAVAALVGAEAWRIERKYTRFGETGVLAELRRRAGAAVELDGETAGLIDTARLWHERSQGRFDITLAPLLELWRFGESNALPDPDAIAAALARTGFERLGWEAPILTLPIGMALDLDGLAKEHAVDRCHDILASQLAAPALVNLGGDLRVTRTPRRGHWRIGIEDANGERAGGRIVELMGGAMATSGDARRHIVNAGRRFGHVLDPRTGWPVRETPHAVSVAAPTCVESGIRAKIALLHGAGASRYLAAAGLRGWVLPSPAVH